MESAFLIEETKSKEEIREELDQLEIQVFRMQQNMKEIAKQAEIVGIDQTKDDNWVIVYAKEEADTFQLMLHDCRQAFRGDWHSALEVAYRDANTLHIAEIKGETNQGYGSVLMNHLKEKAKEENIRYITGDLVERDYDHVDRLTYFYQKHNFEVSFDHEEKCGEIVWNDW